MSNQGYLEQPDFHVKAPWRSALLTYPPNLKAALKEAQADPAKTLFGVGHGIPSPFVTKVIASAKPDFVWIDAEHAMFDRLALHDAIHAAHHHSEGKTMAIVRVPKHDEVSLTTALDAGAAGIIIPCCESAEEVKKAVQEIYYPPIGRRSFSPWAFVPGVSDASLYEDDPFNMQTSNRHIALIAQIESVKGVENADEIAGVDGVSALMFGPGDFSADAGIPIKLGGTPHPTLMAAMGKFAAAGQKHGLPLLGGAMSPEMLPLMIEQGYRLISMTMDTWGLAHLIQGSMKQGREAAQKVGKPHLEEQNGNIQSGSE
ncbi:hypothetical protein FDECE_9523 [Fusarium decemcellulare]|nr:hypothetical protein FDECE_9523 [Fusarium decemcellulare]